MAKQLRAGQAMMDELIELTICNLERRLGKTRAEILADSERQLEPHREVMADVRAACVNKIIENNGTARPA